MSIPDNFLRTICDNLADDGPRLVFADWLEERGDCGRAEFIRVQIELAKLGAPPIAIPSDAMRYLGGGYFEYHFEPTMTVGCTLAKEMPPVGSRVDVLWHRIGRDEFDDKQMYSLLITQIVDATYPASDSQYGSYLLKRDKLSVQFPRELHAKLYARENELLVPIWHVEPTPVGIDIFCSNLWEREFQRGICPAPHVTYRRGFIADITVPTLDMWVTHGPTIIASVPTLENAFTCPTPIQDSRAMVIWARNQNKKPK